MKKIAVFTGIYLLVIGSLSAQSLLSDPGIPDGETIRYKTLRGRKGENIEYSSQSIYKMNEEGNQYYRIQSHSMDLAIETRLDADIFVPVSISKHVSGGRSEIQSRTELVTPPRLNTNEIAILDMSDLTHVLRAYPFDNPQDMKLLFLGEGGEQMGDMEFWIRFDEEETITLNNRNYAAYKLEMKAELSGAMALFSGMIPKTQLWFSREDSHHLLRMESREGPGADKAIVLEMISYTK